MVASLIPRPMKFALLAMLLGSVFPAAGESLRDPTRPSQAFEAAAAMAFGVTGGSGVVAAQSATPVLQSVILSPHKVAAIINGQEVRLGDRIDGASLVKVEETCAVLQGADGRQVLHLYPLVQTSKHEGACAPRPVTLQRDVVRRASVSRSAAVQKKTRKASSKKSKPRSQPTCILPPGKEESRR